MIQIAQIRTYGEKLLADIPEIKKFFLVVSDSQLVSLLQDVTFSENSILVAFIPSHQSAGNNVDDVQTNNTTVWLILNKVDRNEGHNVVIAGFEQTQLIALKIHQQMFLDKANKVNLCSLMRQLVVNSVAIDPVWALAGCDGHEINYQLVTPIF